MNLPSDPIPLYHHISVLASEVITGLQLRPGGNYLDATFGGVATVVCCWKVYQIYKLPL